MLTKKVGTFLLEKKSFFYEKYFLSDLTISSF